jgi:hypothetical protein
VLTDLRLRWRTVLFRHECWEDHRAKLVHQLEVLEIDGVPTSHPDCVLVYAELTAWDQQRDWPLLVLCFAHELAAVGRLVTGWRRRPRGAR